MITRLYVRAQTLLSETKGASAVEYGLLVAGIAAAVITVVFLIGTNANETFQGVADSI